MDYFYYALLAALALLGAALVGVFFGHLLQLVLTWL